MQKFVLVLNKYLFILLKEHFNLKVSPNVTESLLVF